MKKLIIWAGFLLGHHLLQAQQPFTNGRLKVSENKRYLVHQNGTPFFWLGDTAWELFHRLNREEAEQYLKRRAEQGFTVVQAVALAEFDGLKEPNPYGETPLLDNDPTKPNEAYFKHIDYIVDKAAQYGIVIAFLPTWGDKLFKSTWGQGPEIFNPTNARVYGRYVGNRYKNRENIVWILGGDRMPRDGSQDVAVWRAMAEGIQEGVGGTDKALMSYHPQPNGMEGGASKWFQNDDWFDFNMHQNGHCRYTPVYDQISVSYNRQPTKPTMDAEPIYEDHPVCFNVKDLGTSNAYDVRVYAYLDLFAGAHGHTYGCHRKWPASILAAGTRFTRCPSNDLCPETNDRPPPTRPRTRPVDYCGKQPQPGRTDSGHTGQRLCLCVFGRRQAVYGQSGKDFRQNHHGHLVRSAYGQNPIGGHLRQSAGQAIFSALQRLRPRLDTGARRYR